MKQINTLGSPTRPSITKVFLTSPSPLRIFRFHVATTFPLSHHLHRQIHHLRQPRLANTLSFPVPPIPGNEMFIPPNAPPIPCSKIEKRKHTLPDQPPTHPESLNAVTVPRQHDEESDEVESGGEYPRQWLHTQRGDRARPHRLGC